MAYPTKRTDERRGAILAALRNGINRQTAHRRAGLSHTAFYEWLQDDETFLQDVEDAENAFNVSLEAMAVQFAFGVKADPKNKVKARAPSENMVRFLLTHRMPDVYGPKATLKLDKVEEMTDEELLAAAGAILARAQDSPGDEEEGA